MPALLRQSARRELPTVLVGVLLLFALAGHAAAAGPRAADLSLLAEVNRVRSAQGLLPFRLDSRLQRAAESHSGDMLRRHYFSHGDFAARMQRFRPRGTYKGENIAWYSGANDAARAIVRMWLASPPHRANLLRPRFRRVGIAVRVGRLFGSPATVATVDFAGP